MPVSEDQLENFRRNEDPDDIPILKLSREEVREFARKIKKSMAEKKGKGAAKPKAQPKADKLDFMKLPDGMTKQERNLIKYHRDHLRNNTYLDDEQGMTTVFITGVRGPDNRIYNVPGYFDGKRQTEEAARERAARTGWENYPSYETGPSSNEAAVRLHDVIDQDAKDFRTLR